MIAESKRTCRICGEIKELRKFPKQSRVCHSCKNARRLAGMTREALDAHKRYMREYLLKWNRQKRISDPDYERKRLITLKWQPWIKDTRIKGEECETVYVRQCGKCYLCGIPDNANGVKKMRGDRDYSIGRLELETDEAGRLVGLICLGCKVEARAII